MRVRSVVSLILACGGSLCAEQPKEASQANVVPARPAAAATQNAPQPADQRPRKKLKAHFVGSKRPQQHQLHRDPQAKKKSSHIKNEWVVSKTHPKVKQPSPEKKPPPPQTPEQASEIVQQPSAP